MAKGREYYKGEGGGFPQVRAVVNLVSSLLFDLCKSVWKIDPLVTHPNLHLEAPTHPSTLEGRERTPIPYPLVVFTFGFIIEYIKEFGCA
jgi:hypothetical protein